MEERNQAPIETLQDIKQMMERSSRFISLSGLSGLAAGTCALAGVYFVYEETGCWMIGDCLLPRLARGEAGLERKLYLIAGGTFVAAFVAAFFFTWLRSQKNKVPVWGLVARRLMWNVAIPLVTGAVFLYAMIGLNQYELIAPGCLVFYGLALVNASKYTLTDIRYLGYLEITLGLLNSFYPGYGLPFWATGFGLLHIIYGAIMWWKYERRK